ncbi:DUF4383 domain-containing protein [Candidatus Curtissbacteria bacterium]|nr:DUF4383 domain-containing protein [Candidatus Curtissbacteria bacterium]
MNPKQFLILVGAVLLLIGVLGFVGVLGPTAAQSIFGSSWWFDTGENVAHTVLGLVALGGAFALDSKMQRTLTMVYAVVTLFFGVYGFVSSSAFGLANLENPMDNILHLGVGVWAAYVAWFRK